MAQFHFMGRLGDSFGSIIDRDIPESVTTITQLKTWLDNENGAEQLRSPSIRAAINDVIAPDSAAVTNADKIVFLPPIGGG